MALEVKKVLEILDKNVNQEQLLKDLGAELVLPLVKDKLLAVDLIPGTTIDNEILKKVVEYLEKVLV